MKKIDILVLKTAVGPFIATLFVGNLVFLMQFLYKKIDDLIGKGLGWEVIAEFVMYASFTIIPLSLPLAVLVASIMTMGNLGERYELVAIKSSGVSLLRAMRALIIAAFILSGVAFYFSNNVMPYSLLKLSTLGWDIKNKKATMLLKEGVFFNDFENMTLRVERKGEDDMLYDLTIYDHRKAGETRVIKADSATIEYPDSSSYMLFHLMDGKLHEDANIKKRYTRFGFKTLDLIVDMKSFELGSTNENLFKNNPKIKNVQQITETNDSLALRMTKIKQNLKDDIPFELYAYRLNNPRDSLASTETIMTDSKVLSDESYRYSKAITRAKIGQQKVRGYIARVEPIKEDITEHKIYWYQKFALAFSCVILFFIGAPMGALVRKGGFGMPIVVGVVFYLIYYIINITGTRLAEQQVVSPLFGIWLSTIVLFPLALLLTRMAVADMKINLISSFITGIERIFNHSFTKK